MAFKRLKNYFKKLDETDKIQSKSMEKDIERSKYIAEARLQGGKAVGEIVKPKKKK